MQDLTNTIRLSPSRRGLRAAAALLERGGVVAFPTETVYGLGAIATDPVAVARIFEAKGRPRFNPLIVHVPDMDSAEAVAEIPQEARILASTFWPGALTLVMPRRAGVLPDITTAGLDTVAVRMPAHALARDLLAKVGAPLAAPSANPSGRISATTADHVMQGMSGRIAGVLDGGPCSVGVESTIVALCEGDPVLLRPGGIPAEAIEAALGRPLSAHEGPDITAPGQLPSHYAPDVQLVLNAAAVPGEDAIWLAFGPLAGRSGLSLSDHGDQTEAAARLFAALHEIDELAKEAGQDRVLVDPVPDHGLGRAINDRLRRAAAPR